jgi:hypothetical protein
MGKVYVITARKGDFCFLVGASATLPEAIEIAKHQKEFMKGGWEILVDEVTLGSYNYTNGEMEIEEDIYKC